MIFEPSALFQLSKSCYQNLPCNFRCTSAKQASTLFSTLLTKLSDAVTLGE